MLKARAGLRRRGRRALPSVADARRGNERQPAPAWRTSFRCALAVVALATVLAACSGDFDRPRPLVFGEDSTFGVPLALVEPPQSQFAFTDAERRMRELAYPLLLPPDGGGLWELVPVDLSYLAVMADQGPPYDVKAYGTTLMTMPARSEVERYAQLIDAITADMSRIDLFNATARHVLAGDQERLHNLSAVPGLTVTEQQNARIRVAENARIIKRVGVCLRLRAAAYRYAGQRLAIAVPSHLLADVDRKLATYERRINPFDGIADGAPVAGVHK